MTRTIKCKECGGEHRARRDSAEFCSNLCRSNFNTRRRERGVELYDVLMSANFDEGNKAPKELVVLMLSAYRMADNEKRDGRKSWQRWQQSQARLPIAYGKAGDNR